MGRIRNTALASLAVATAGVAVLVTQQIVSASDPTVDTEKERAGSAVVRPAAKRDVSRPDGKALNRRQRNQPKEREQVALDSSDALHLELEQLFASIHKPAAMSAEWRSTTINAYETVQKRIELSAGTGLVLTEGLKCGSNGCSGKLVYSDPGAYQRGLAVLEGAEELRPFPRAYTAPMEDENGHVAAYVFLFLSHE